MEEAYTDENLGPAYEEEDNTPKGPRTFNALMLGGIYLRAAAGETGNEDEFGKELCKEITKSEQDHIHACLQAASGVLNEDNMEALTVYKLVMAGRNDPEYTSLKHLLENNLPWGGECKSYEGQNRKLLSTSQGIVM